VNDRFIGEARTPFRRPAHRASPSMLLAKLVAFSEGVVWMIGYGAECE
jgi:hypothetical protein